MQSLVPPPLLPWKRAFYYIQSHFFPSFCTTILQKVTDIHWSKYSDDHCFVIFCCWKKLRRLNHVTVIWTHTYVFFLSPLLMVLRTLLMGINLRHRDMFEIASNIHKNNNNKERKKSRVRARSSNMESAHPNRWRRGSFCDFFEQWNTSTLFRPLFLRV